MGGDGSCFLVLSGADYCPWSGCALLLLMMMVTLLSAVSSAESCGVLMICWHTKKSMVVW
jgi:hypothetical protein